MELLFPEETIQHIQSFLNAKEAAQTPLLSKSWYTAWLTRPNLYFDQQHFVSDDHFWEFVNNILQRYHKLNLTIHSFHLWILHVPEHSHSLVNKLIITALQMGATDLDFKIYRPNFEFALPHQVFAFQDLTRLSVSGCKIDKREVVRCSRLKSLVLEGIIIGVKLLWDIISCCPSIENFSFFNIRRPLYSKYFHFGLQHVSYDEAGLPNAFHKLKRLLLYLVNFDYAYFDDFSSKFPCLEDLAFHNCNGGREVMKISSPSLQRITYTDDECRVIRLEFDVPRICKFTFSGIDVPLLSFKSSSTRIWESDISIQYEYPPHGGRFLKLRELLKELSLSKVSLSLKFMSDKIYACKAYFRDVTDKPEVENLTVMGPQALDSVVFNTLFRCCCPIYVSRYVFPKKCTGGELKSKRKRKGKKCTDGEEQYDFSKMIQQVSLNSCIAYQRMAQEGESDLEEVRVEFYDESVSAWSPRLLDTSTALEAAADDDEHRIRLHLIWGR
ncbi:hypothetical protein OROHE_022771 [Orobanche hederae]